MAPKVPLDVEMLHHVFGARKDIFKGIEQAADTPDRIVLFNTIATFVYNQLQVSHDEPATKRRRVDVDTISQANGHASTSKGSNGAAVPVAGARNAASGVDAAATEQVLLEIKDISVSAPQRKKYDLCFTKNFLYARASGTTVPVQGIVYPWRDIEHAFYLPVPEKSAVQHNYVLFPRNSYLPTAKQPTPQADESSPLEPLVFTIPATAPKPGSIAGPSAASASPFSDSYTTLFNWALSTHLSSAGNSCRIVSADPKLFHSVARQPFRSSEKAVHVKGFRGSKDGYLFFLPTGILWGFKKPLLFLPLDRIVALSYTSVLQRTFNIVVEYEGYAVNGEQPTEEIEFAMLDQEDYAGIDQNYVRRHGLADGSMAEQRKAKRELAENDKKGKGEGGEGGEGEAGGADDNGMTELEKAQLEAEQALQDEEDEEEEDYDPGSEGESEGSGSSDDDDDDDDDDGDEDGEGGEDDDDEDLEDGEGDTEMAG